jgi:peptide/nickel transport system substrate-binding protein
VNDYVTTPLVLERFYRLKYRLHFIKGGNEMKRLLVLVLATMLIAGSLVGCTGSDKVSGTLIVGCPPISGDFIYGFGNSSYDKWIKDLTGGYMDTYVATKDGELALNKTVVKNVDTSVDGDGNKTYTYELHNDLKWNDGSAITAKDYVFCVLWEASPQWVEAGASSTNGDSLVGYKAYYKGDSPVFTGVKLIDEYKFSVTIAAENLPYFYETSFASVRPLPMDSWAPAAKIVDEITIEVPVAGQEKEEDPEMEEKTFQGTALDSDSSVWTLKDNAQGIAGTERFSPTVSCGPYIFQSFENNAVTLKVNPHFKADANGKTPKLEFVVVQAINQKTDVDQVLNKSVDAVTGVVEGEKIEKGKNDSKTKVNYYPRNGYGGVFIHCDFGPTKDLNVRHALAYLMDRTEIIQHVLGGYGSIVNGMYGLAQWMYEDNKTEIDALPNFVLNVETANDLLDKTEWKFEKDGKTAFDRSKAKEGSDYFRYNAAGEMLAINHLGSEDNDVTDAVEMQFLTNCPLAGIKFSLTRADFAKLLTHYYEGHTLTETGKEPRQFNTFNLATGFTVVFDPYYSYHSDMYYVTYEDTEHLKDEKLDEIIIKMRSLEPTQVDEYSAAWLEFQTRWNELLPVIPLYSNQYYDIYGDQVEGFATNPFQDWSEVICEISKTK